MRGKAMISGLSGILIVAGLLGSAAAHAATRAGAVIHVTTGADDVTKNGNCTLREALQAADTNKAVDTCAAGTGPDTIVVPAVNVQLHLGVLNAHSTVSIVGAGSGTVLKGQAGSSDSDTQPVGLHVFAG